MKVTSYSEIRDGVAEALGWEPSLLDSKQWKSIRRAVTKSLARVWEDAWWRDLTRVERRQFRDSYSTSITYDVGDEVYFPGADAYFQAVREATNQVPATLVADEWVTNFAYWAEAVPTIMADDYDATATYALGDQVRYPYEGSFWQLHTVTPLTGPPDTTYWGRVVAFDAYVPWVASGFTSIGRVRETFLTDPRNGLRQPLTWEPRPNGVQFPGYFSSQSWDADRSPRVGWSTCHVARPWIDFRIRAPHLIGDIWDPTVAYTPTEDGGEGGTVPPSIVASGYREFETVADMVADPAVDWATALCVNYLAGDSWMSFWTRSRLTNLVANNADLLAAIDGSILGRVWVREHTDPQFILPPATGPAYNVAAPKYFPTITDVVNSRLSLSMLFVGDANENVLTFVRDPTATNDGVQNVEWITNAAGISYKRVAIPLLTGAGSPEGVKVATPGHFYLDTDLDQLYLKNTGSGDTGWTLLV